MPEPRASASGGPASAMASAQASKAQSSGGEGNGWAARQARREGSERALAGRQPGRSRSIPGSRRLIAAVEIALAAGALAAAAALALSQAMTLPLSHDEHQFVVGGWWLGEHGLLPYRDFPFHHLPNLLFLYALVGRWTPSLLLNARVVSVTLSLATLAVLFLFARQRLRGSSRLIRWLVGLAAALMLLLSPLFAFTSGRAWNHALPTLLSVAAFLVHLSAERRVRTDALRAGSGVLLGLAVGSRLSYLPALIPFLGFLLLRPACAQGRSKLRGMAAFLLGFGASLLPTLLLAALAPRPFAYGTLIYPGLNTRYRQALWHPTGMNLPEKLAFFGERVVLDPAHAMLLALYVALAVTAAARSRGHGWMKHREFWFASGVALLLWIGSMAPTPAWYQYFYAPLPFLLLGMLIMVVALLQEPGRRRRVITITGAAALAMILLRFDALMQIKGRLDRSQWIPVEAHRLGERVGETLEQGSVLTLAPIVPAEAGLQPYPELTTGSFDWRVSRFFSAERRAIYGVLSPDDLAGRLGADPPAGILVGFEAGNEGFSLGEKGGLERPLEAYAIEHGYTPLTLESALSVRDLTLWVRP